MKIKRFTAPDMRAAIRQIREDQGPDAVILSSNKVAGGIEIVAATDYDEALVQQAARVHRSKPADDRQPNQASSIARKTGEQAEQICEPVNKQATETKAAPQKANRKIVWAQDPAIGKLQNDLNSLRLSIEGQLRSLHYDMQAPSAEHSEAMQTLTSMGIDAKLARALVNKIDNKLPGNRIRSQALIELASKLPVPQIDTLLQGGHVALIGPTGVGKTTTIAKLAAHYAMNHSKRDIVIVTTDHYRIGAQEQLFTFGRLLGIPVHTLEPKQPLSDLLKKLSDYRLVLIDTAGMSPRDPRLSEQLAALNLGGKIKNYLVMPASGQAQDLDELAARFADVPLSGCILTTLDETSRLGGALSVAINRGLSIDYICDGQRVPEDIHRTKQNELVVRAMRAAGNELPRRSEHRPEPQTSEPRHACA